MATHSNILPIFWEMQWAEEPGGLQSQGYKRVRHNLAAADITTLFVYSILPKSMYIDIRHMCTLLMYIDIRHMCTLLKLNAQYQKKSNIGC